MADTTRRSRKPRITAGLRNGRWERALADCHATKQSLRSLRSFGYTKVRLEDVTGTTDEFKIEELL